MSTFDGCAETDRRLWRTYVQLAREHAIQSGGEPAVSKVAFVDDPTKLLPKPSAEALQTVIFSCFALEYRLKRVLSELGRPLRRDTDLETLVKKRFWSLLQDTPRCDGKGKCVPPGEWAKCMPELRELTRLRGDIAHARYEKVLQFLERKDSAALARSYYNAVVDAMMLINIGTGYDPRPADEVRDYFQPVKVAEK